MKSEIATPPIAAADIKTTIAHEVIKRGNHNEFMLNLSEKSIDLSQDTKDMILRKLGELLRQSVPMEINPDNKVTNIVKQIPGMGQDEFVKQSKIIAQELKYAQSGSGAKEGVLIVMHAINSTGQDIVLIIKSEFGEGIRASFVNGNKTEMELLNNIIFTKTDYYKIGAFLRAKEKWHCRLWDSGAKLNKKLTAKYFYKKFLMLDMMQDNATRTLMFYEHSKIFIDLNYQNLDMLNKTALLSTYLKSSNKLIEINKFAESNLMEKKDEYIEHMYNYKTAKLSGNFVKDMSLIEKYLKVINIWFGGEINFSVPHDKYGSDFIVISEKDAPSVAENDEQWTYVKIKGEVKSKK